MKSKKKDKNASFAKRYGAGKKKTAQTVRDSMPAGEWQHSMPYDGRGAMTNDLTIEERRLLNPTERDTLSHEARQRQDRIDELLGQRVTAQLGEPGKRVDSGGKSRPGGVYQGRVVGWEHGRYTWAREVDGYYLVILDAFPGEWLNVPVRLVKRA